ncbi:hypothetical protein CW745_08105 [Psychromonas sp. psych-6C06]|uniref:sensor domain-containing diguanylate cyclase n=1 Tax=Psychromonas sp. psych-6C06 TaxID=2058089 RepID=UPI000C33244D|nr:diguanylate cyclase [Psychromonas sp. psych-6C06]PKF61940.1 hypothetical protein CW745_08105 [Psychromonas sp. psych-6C06]
MKPFLLEQISITQQAFLGSQDAKSLIAKTSQFLSLILHPKNIFFCIESEQLQCLAQHEQGQPIRHLELSPTQLDTHIQNEQLWSLAGQKEKLSRYLPITYLAINDINNIKQDWYCIKLQMTSKPGILIFLQSPQNEMMQHLQEAPLFAALMMQFFHLLQQYRLNQTHKSQLLLRDKQEALYLQEIEQQKLFSSKVLKIQSITQDFIASPNLTSLYKTAIEMLRDMLGFDRACLILADANQHMMHPTFGTDTEGKTTDESDLVYDMEVLEPLMQHTLLHTQKRLEVVENVPLYNERKVVGIGWNAMLILRNGDHLLGWIAIDNLLSQRPLLEYEKEVLILYSNILSTAIAQKSEQSNLKLLHDSAILLSHQETELEICRVAVEIAREKLQLDRVAIFLSYDDGKTMCGTFGTSINGKLTDETHFRGPLPKNSLLELAMATPHHLAFEGAVPLYHDNKIVGHGWNAAILLRNQQRIVGFLVLDNLINKRSLTSHVQHLLTLFASNLAEIISRKRAEESLKKLNNELESIVEERTEQLAMVNLTLEETNKQLEQLSLVDPLTEISNRRHFDQTYKIEWAKACRHSQNLSAIMFDIDYFKSYNDHYGHPQGDQCLTQVAHIIQKHFRRADELVARYGGEEFIVLLSNSSPEQVKARIQAIIDDLYTSHIEHVKSPLQRVTLSAGIASVTIHKRMQQATLIKWADEALYQAKLAGRNGLVSHQQASINSL